MSTAADSILRRLKERRQKQRTVLAMRWRCSKVGKEFKELDTFHRGIRPYLCVAQLFGIMPLANVLSRDPLDVGFRIRSIGMCFTGLFLVLGGIEALMKANILLQTGLNAKNMMNLVFLIVGIVNWLNFTGFARSWSSIILPWSSLDILMQFPPYAPCKHSLRSKLRLIGCVVGSMAVVDHLLYYASGYHSYHMRIFHCHTNHSRLSFGSYLKQEFSDIFQLLPYNMFSICYGFWIHVAFTFLWNFMDIFIVLTSIGLAQRFKQFANRVLALTGRQVPDALWYDIRRDHIRLCELASLVDASMGNIVFLSCANNVYVICNQALAIFTKLQHPINYVYFWYSLLFLLARTSLVFMSASKIHDASLLPLRTLYLVPSTDWTEEVQRFVSQLTSEFVGLSGYRLFYLTRKSLFGMMATLVTYELMLLQMNAKGQKAGLPDLCA